MKNRINRRAFLGATLGASLAGVGTLTRAQDGQPAAPQQETKPPVPPQDSLPTNLHTALAVPRTGIGMPGPWPGIVAAVSSETATKNRMPVAETVNAMFAAGMKALAGSNDPRDAWATLFAPQDRIGIKVNPVGPKLVQTTHEVVRAVIANLEAIGVARANIAIWDRLQPMLDDAGFTTANYPGIECLGIARQVTENGVTTWLGDDRMDKSVFYEFPLETAYEGEDVYNQINTGHHSYYTNLLTRRFDKVINLPVPKDNGPTFTICMKNMAYGSLSNVRRGHQMGGRFIAEACAFPPIRDKVVLNIVDGLRACYKGGPEGVAAAVWPLNTLYFATDPVAADAVVRDVIAAKQTASGVEMNERWQRSRAAFDTWLPRAENLGLGVFRNRPIDLRSITV